MKNIFTSTKRSFSLKASDKQAIRESLAPFAPYPEALNHDIVPKSTDYASKNTSSKTNQ